MAAFLNDPIVLPLAPMFAAPLPNQPLLVDVVNGAPTITNEIPADGTTTAPPLALLEVLVVS